MKYITSLLIIIMSLGFVSVATAQTPDKDTNPDGRGRHGRGGHHIILDNIAEALGLEPEALRDLLAEDEEVTLAEIITTQGGDVDEIQAQIVAAIDEVSDKELAEIEEHVAEVLNNPLPRRGEGGFGGRRGFGGRPDGDSEEAPVAPDAGTEEAPAGDPA